MKINAFMKQMTRCALCVETRGKNKDQYWKIIIRANPGESLEDFEKRILEAVKKNFKQ